MRMIKDNYKQTPDISEQPERGILRKLLIVLMDVTSRGQDMQAKVDRYH